MDGTESRRDYSPFGLYTSCIILQGLALSGNARHQGVQGQSLRQVCKRSHVPRQQTTAGEQGAGGASPRSLRVRAGGQGELVWSGSVREAEKENGTHDAG